MQLTHLPRVTSDHTPLLFECRLHTSSGRRTFRFLDSWLIHPDFYNYMQNAWLSYPTTGGMYGFYSKLFYLKRDIQRWNKDIFGNIFQNLMHAESHLNHAEAIWEADPTDATMEAYHHAKAKYFQASTYELHFLKQKAMVKWINEGDANTRYFHSIVKGRRTTLRIQQIRSSSGALHMTPAEIMTEAVSFYTTLFAREPTYNHPAILSHIPCLTKDDNIMLTQLPTTAEVKEAVWHLDP